MGVGTRADGAARDAQDRRLLDRVRGGDAAAFEALYRRFHPRLWRFLMNMLRRPPLVEEVLNDTMLALWRRPERFDGSSRLSTFIFAIAYRQGLQALRCLDLPVEEDPAHEPVDHGPGPDAVAGRAQLAGRLDAAIAALPVAQRLVVELTYAQELSYREIAEVLDCPVDTVKTRMFHARRRLRALLGGHVTDWI